MVESVAMETTQMPSQGIMYGTVCRVNFWIKMTTALGVTQIVIGLGCMAFYSVAYFTDATLEHLVTYVAVGIVAGGVILAAGILGSIASRQKTKCRISSFLALSALSAMFAMFPMVLGIVGATNPSLEHDSLLMPICQLVFATVEIVVATWSVGVCCQALCCPNTTFGQVSTRLPSGLGVTQFISSGDGQHVVLFTGPQGQPLEGLMYRVPRANVPYVIQQGIPTVQLAVQPGIACGVGTNISAMSEAPEVTPQTAGVKATSDEEEDESGKLLHGGGAQPVGGGDVREEGDGGYEVEDEAAHLLC